MESFLQVLTAFIQYSSWPITVIIVAIIFKKPLMNLKKIKVKECEFEIGEEIESLSKKVKKGKKDKDWKITSKKYLKDNMDELAEVSPLAVILQSWDILCDMITLEAQKVSVDSSTSICTIIQTLYDKNFVCKGNMNLFLRLYALKERMINFENEKTTKNRALEYADTALSVGGSIVEEIQLHANR